MKEKKKKNNESWTEFYYEWIIYLAIAIII